MKKTKNFFALLLAMVMVLGLAACNKPKEPAPADPQIDCMTAPIDALARCMLENDMEYDPEDPDFFWTALYYFTGAYGLEHELVKENDNYQLIVPTKAMQEHATALFADYDDLMELPDIMLGNVAYDEAEDAYLVSQGDKGLSEMRLTAFEETEEGFDVTAELWGVGPEEELIASFDVTLVENAYTDGIQNPIYLFSVASMKMTENNSHVDYPVLEPDDDPYKDASVETAIFNGLSDSHSVEAEVNDEISVFQFETGSDVANYLSGLESGDSFTFYYKTDQQTGVPFIVGIQ